MSTLAALAAAGLLARICAAAQPAGAGEVRVEGNVRYEVGTGRVVVEDGAVLRRGAVVLRARSATYDPATGEVRATGNVLLTDATRAVAADSVRAVLGGDVEAEGVVAFVKGEPVDLSRAVDLSEARRLGRNRLSFSGERLAGDPVGRFRLTRARLTLCDCGEGRAPSWEITARDADVVAGRRAILRWAVLRIAPAGRPFPVLAVPWLYLPLGERQSGLLPPEYWSTGATGHVLGLPVFVTLGRSADATITPEWAFGGSSDRRDVGRARGPAARLELRWAPAPDAEGRAETAWIHDLDREPGGAGGDRFGLEVAHVQRISGRTRLRADLRLASDAVWVRDVAADALARSAPYRRSAVLLSHRRGDVLGEVGATYLQPFFPEGTAAGERYGSLGADVGVANRWPGASATLLPAAAGPLRISARAGAARYAPVASAWDARLRPAASRADARVEVALPLLVGRALTVAPYLRGAAAAYAPEASADPRAGGWGVAGAVVSSEVSRRFGELRHSIAPRLEWRAGTDVAGRALAWAAYDEMDRSAVGVLSAAEPGPFHQLRAALETRLDLRGAQLLRLEIAQDADLESGRLAEAHAAAALAVGPLGADASVRWFPAGRPASASAGAPPAPTAPGAAVVLPGRLDELTELRANLSLTDRRGDALRAGFLSVGPGGSGSLLVGLDPLFDVRARAIPAAAFATAGVRVVAGGATLGYDALLPGRASLVPLCSGAGSKRVEGWQPSQHTARLAWTSRCRCFRIVAHASITGCGELSGAGASIDLGALGAGLRAP